MTNWMLTMHDYTPPLRHMRFVLHELLDHGAIQDRPRWADATPDLVNAVLEEAGRFASGVLAPLNRAGDRQGCRLSNGAVTTPQGFPDAYQQSVDNGWNSLSCPTEHGGQGLPGCVATATQEMWHAANMAFALCPMLTAGAIEAIEQHGSPEQQRLYLPRLISGEWTGTMNLTEPQAGTDLAAVVTRAVPDGDRYRLYGQKIYITWGEHDCAANIVHLVLARTPDAPAGVKGLSLFIVPKFLPDDNGEAGERNDVRCVSIEHKLGIHGSPTCTMVFGEHNGAIGDLIGEEGQGLACMFTMMNEARHKVGVEGLSISDRALQQARAYANDRVQGRPAGASGHSAQAIIHHPDVRRMLLTMQAGVEAMRCLCYYAAWCMDLGREAADQPSRAAHSARADLLIPIVKGWCTELSQELTSLGLQVHGGMGYVEDTGAAQHLRDARITAIYEGTTAIQGNDLIGRKTYRDRGQAIKTLAGELRADADALGAIPAMAHLGDRLRSALDDLDTAADWIVAHHGTQPAATAASAVPYLMQAGYVIGGGLMARAARRAHDALAADPDDAAFYTARIDVARYYLEQLLPRANGLLPAVLSGQLVAEINVEVLE